MNLVRLHNQGLLVRTFDANGTCVLRLFVEACNQEKKKKPPAAEIGHTSRQSRIQIDDSPMLTFASPSPNIVYALTAVQARRTRAFHKRTLMAVETYGEKEKKRLGELKFSTPANRMRWPLKPILDAASHNARFVMRRNAECVCFDQSTATVRKSSKFNSPPGMVCENRGINASYRFANASS